MTWLIQNVFLCAMSRILSTSKIAFESLAKSFIINEADLWQTSFFRLRGSDSTWCLLDGMWKESVITARESETQSFLFALIKRLAALYAAYPLLRIHQVCISFETKQKMWIKAHILVHNFLFCYGCWVEGKPCENKQHIKILRGWCKEGKIELLKY